MSRAGALTADEIRKLMSAALSSRDYAIVAVAYASGLRCAELCSLRWADVDEERGLLVVRCGKGAKARVVEPEPFAWDALARLRTLAGRHDRASDPVLVTIRGGPFSERGLRAVLERLRARGGVDGAHLHMLRHSFATHRAATRGVRATSKALGHARSTTTSLYVHPGVACRVRRPCAES